MYSRSRGRARHPPCFSWFGTHTESQLGACAFDPCAGSGRESMQGRRHPPPDVRAARGAGGAAVWCARVSVAVMCGAGWATCSCEAVCGHGVGVARRKTRATRVPLRHGAASSPPATSGATIVCAPHSPAQAVGCAAREAGAGSGVRERREPARDAVLEAVSAGCPSPSVCVRPPGWRRARALEPKRCVVAAQPQVWRTGVAMVAMVAIDGRTRIASSRRQAEAREWCTAWLRTPWPPLERRIRSMVGPWPPWPPWPPPKRKVGKKKSTGSVRWLTPPTPT